MKKRKMTRMWGGGGEVMRMWDSEDVGVVRMWSGEHVGVMRMWRW